jgi:hemerythrin-like domain-containing protein
MTPTETLVREHEVILRVVDVAAGEAIRVREHGRADGERVGKIADFLSGFADACHHAKEEKLLFPRLKEIGAVEKGCPVEQLMEEHDEGRAHVRAMRENLPRAANGDRAAALTLATHLADYAALLREHIRKENDLLFPCADHHLSADDQRDLAQGFERVEREETGEGEHERFHRLAEELAGPHAGTAGV